LFREYMGTGLILMWYLLALIYLWIREKRKNCRVLFIYMPIIFLLLFFNPLFAKIIYTVADDEIYYRILWLLPITMTIAFTLVDIYGRLEGAKKSFFPVVAGLLVVVSGSFIYANPHFGPAENIYHVPQSVVDICDAIEVEGREVMAAFPTEFLLYVRQYTQGVCMPYGRTVLMGYYDDFHGLIMSEEIQVEELAQMAKASKCHYVILPEKTVLIGDMEAFDYEVFDSMHGYVIYVDNSIYRGL